MAIGVTFLSRATFDLDANDELDITDAETLPNSLKRVGSLEPRTRAHLRDHGRGD